MVMMMMIMMVMNVLILERCNLSESNNPSSCSGTLPAKATPQEDRGQQAGQTPSTGLRHPSFSHCRI